MAGQELCSADGVENLPGRISQIRVRISQIGQSQLSWVKPGRTALSPLVKSGRPLKKVPNRIGKALQSRAEAVRGGKKRKCACEFEKCILTAERTAVHPDFSTGDGAD